MAAIFATLANTFIDKAGSIIEKKEETHKIEVQGEIKKQLIIEEGKVKIETIKEQGKVDIKKMEIENEKQKINNEHEKDMKGMEYDYLLKDKTLDKEHEINILKQKQEEKRQEEELKIKADDHHAKNERDMN